MTPAVCPDSPVGAAEKKVLMFIVRQFLWRRRNDCSSRGSTGFSNAFILCALSWAAIRIKWGNQLFALIKIYRHTARQIERQPRLQRQIQLQIHLQIQHKVSEWVRKKGRVVYMPSYQFHLQCELWLCFVLFFLLLMVFHAAGALIKAGKFISLFRRQWSWERTVGVQLNCVKLDVLQRYSQTAQCDVQRRDRKGKTSWGSKRYSKKE